MHYRKELLKRLVFHWFFGNRAIWDCH